MRNLVFVLLIASLVFGTSIVKEFTFSEKNLTIKKVAGYDQLAMTEPITFQSNAAYFIYPTEEGKPLIPFYSLSLLIPATAEMKEVTVLDYEKVTIPGEYYLYPTQRPVPISQDVPISFIPPDNSIYSLTTEYPEKRVDIIKTGCKSGYRVAGIFLYPISYIPKEKSLFFYKRIKVRIDYEEGVYRPQLLTPSQKMLFSRDVMNLVINHEDIERFSPPIRQSDDPEIDYIIITSSDLTANFMPLVNWLRKIGIWADTISTNSINSNYSGRDLQEKIRNFIKDCYTNHGLKYVLLAGDNSIIPARQARAIVSGETGNIPCDLYYADLQWSWDGDNDNVFGEQTVDTVDLYYDLYVGRASVENASEVSNFINKLLTYEQNPDTTYQKRILLPWGTLWSGYDSRQSQDTIANYSPSDWTDQFINDTRVTNEVRDSLNHGFGFCHMIGHGNETGIYWTSSGPVMYSTSHPSTQTNTNKLVIANSIACYPGNFEYSDCLAEAMMNASACAVAVMMNSRYGWGYTSQIGPSELLDVRFYDFLFLRDTFRIAAAHQRSKEVYRNTAISQQVWRWCYYELNLFGEPYMPMWTDYPQSMVANFINPISTGNQTFTVTVNSSGSPLSQATVNLWKGSEVYVKGITNASGQVTLTINPVTNGYMYVTVTAKNKILFADSCQVTTFSHDIGVVQITIPSGTVDSTEQITPQARVRNNGTNNETFNVTFRIGAGYSQTRSKTLSSGCEDTVNFPAWMPVRGTNTTRCSTYFAGDVNPNNDTLSGSVTVQVHDVGITQIIAPIETVDSGTVVIPQVIVKNFGTNAVSFPGTFRISTFYINTQNVTDLNAGDSVVMSFALCTLRLRGSHSTKCTTALVGDQNLANNTLSGSILVRVHDVGVVVILEPIGTIDSGTVVIPKAVAQNFGNILETFSVRFKIGTFYSNDTTIILATGAIDTVEFSSWIAIQIGTHITKCTTLLNGDLNCRNDYINDSVIVQPMVGFNEPSVTEPLPKVFALANNLPNPFVAHTFIRYSLAKECRVNLQVYNSSGILVRTLKSGILKAGSYRTIWDGKDDQGVDVIAGVYFYTIKTNDYKATKKLVLMR